MKTLSIQQPWASLVCSGIKDVENRTWKAAEIPGRILIHASSKKVTKDFYASIPEEMGSYIANHEFFGNIAPLTELPTSAIIGYVTVTSFETDYTGSVWDGGPQAIKWKLEDAWMFDEPILNVNGKLNLFEYDLDENNLPPAHQVKLRQMALKDGEVIVPTTDENIDIIIKDKIDMLEFFVTSDNLPILCKKTKDGFEYEPQKSLKLEGEKKTLRFELEDSGIYWAPNPNDETKPLEIEFHDGSWGQWQVYQFLLGKRLDEEEFVEICGGLKYDMMPDLEKAFKELEDENVIKFNVSKDVFNDIVNGRLGVFEKEIKPNTISKYFKTDKNGDVIVIDGVPQFRMYYAIQFTNKENSYTCLINDADLLFMNDQSNGMISYSELDNDVIDYTEGVIAYTLGEKIQ